MFSCKKLDVSKWNTSEIKSIASTFTNCSSIETLDLSSWNTINVSSMYNTFSGCTNLVTLDVSEFNTSNVTNMTATFRNCKNLKELDLTKWNTEKVTTMNHMFINCISLTKLELENFDTTNVTSMNYMFSYCSSITILDVSSFNTSNVTLMQHMFNACSSLLELDVSGFDTSKVTDMEGMFGGCKLLSILNVSNWDTSSVTDMSAIFSECAELTSLDISNFDTSKVTTMELMFYGCNKLSTIDVSNFTTDLVTNMSSMFQDCYNVIELDLSNFNTSKINEKSHMFFRCRSLQKVTLGEKFTFNGDSSYLPTPSSTYIPGATGVWYRISDGKSFAPEDIPNNEIATYVAVSKNYTYNVEYKSESGLDLGSTTVTKWYGTTNTIVAPAITGYNTPASQNVTWDTETKTITFIYEPTSYSITINCNGGSGVSSTSYTIETETFELGTPTRTGYTFLGWTDINGTTQASVTILKGSIGAKSYTANWKKDKLPGSISLPSTVRLGVGQNGSINVAEGNVTGGTVTMTNSDSTVVSTTFNGSTVSLVGLKVGTAILTFNVAETENYTAATGQTTIIVYDANTPYTVKHWQQTVTGGDAHNDTNFALHETESLKGEGGASVTPTPKSYTGFTAPSGQTVTIANDGTTIVNYYYTRNSYTVSLTKGTGISTVTGASSYKYGASVTIDATASSGYAWEKWTGTHNTTTKRYTFTMPAGNVNDTANAIVAVAQAIYSADDNSFTFVRRTPYSVGDVFVDRDGNSKTVTEVYTGFETEEYGKEVIVNFMSTTIEVPWESIRTNVTKVVVEDTIKPISAYQFFGYFRNCTYFDVRNIDLSNCTNMYGMFAYAGRDASSVTITGMDEWDTSKVTDMSWLFDHVGYGATSVDIGDLSEWDTSKVTDMTSMFQSIGYDIPTFVQDLSKWDVSSVTDMTQMFSGLASAATTWSVGDLSEWDVSNVTDMKYMFSVAGWSANSFNVGNLTKWKVSNVTDMSYMFNESGKNSSTWYVGDISTWDVSNVTSMQNMFNCAGYSASYYLDLSGWDVSSITTGTGKQGFNTDVTSKVIAPSW